MKHILRLSCLLLSLALLTGCSLLGVFSGDRGQNYQNPTFAIPSDSDLEVPGANKLEAIMAIIDERFIGEYSEEELADILAAALVQGLGDQWSYYIPASEYASYMETANNAYVGIGITIQVREDETGFDIVKVEKTGPAYEAGIRPGDILTHANGTEVGPIGTGGASAIIKGEEGTTVEVTVSREGQPITMTVERRTIEVIVAEGQMLPGNVGYIAINNFDARCAQETIAVIEDLRKQGAQKLLFDVRYNPGGYAHELVALLDYLLPAGDLFIAEDYRGNRSVDPSDDSCLKMPMAVLVNADSYSAAEFFAAALQEYEWAAVVGQHTTGKGYFQQTYALTDGSALHLSVGKYFTPKGKTLANVGIAPDVECLVDEETYYDIYYDRMAPADDPQIQAALETLKNR